MWLSVISHILHIHSIIYTTYSLHVLSPGQNYILWRNPQKSTLQCVFETFQTEYFSDTLKNHTTISISTNMKDSMPKYIHECQSDITPATSTHCFPAAHCRLRWRWWQQRARFNAGRGHSGQRVRRMTHAAKGHERYGTSPVLCDTYTQMFKLYRQ
jgi:hypothetical protein